MCAASFQFFGFRERREQREPERGGEQENERERKKDRVIERRVRYLVTGSFSHRLIRD